MQEIIKQQDTLGKTHFQNFSIKEQRRLVGVFVWLVEQDKKQNPAIYQNNKKKYD